MSNSNDHKNTKQIQSQDNEEKLAVNNKPYINKRRQNFIERCRDASIVRKIVFIVIILFTVLIVYGAKSAYEFISTGLSPVDPESEETIEVDIPLGSSSKELLKF